MSFRETRPRQSREAVALRRPVLPAAKSPGDALISIGIWLLGRLRRLALLVSLLVVWEVLGTVVLPRIAPHYLTLMPPPSLVVAEGWGLIERGLLLGHVLASLRRVAAAFAIAALVAIPLGIAIGWWRWVDEMVDPVVELLRPIPPIAWIPLGILWFGIGDAQNIFIIFLGAFFPIVVNTVAGVRSVDKVIVWATLTLGANQRQILGEIVVPGALPQILTGLRVGLGVGWMCLVAAELVAAASGIGYMIEDARFMLLTERVILGMATIGVLGFLMDRGMRLVQRRLVCWQVGVRQ